MLNYSLTTNNHFKNDFNFFNPGELIYFRANFSSIPEKFRLRILDQKENTRLNHYNSGKDNEIFIRWRIPNGLRKDHLGIWQIIIDTDNDQFRLFFNVKVE
ncbi:hypothetical protein [Candidatus Hodarchaeum mangrovi]